MRSRSLDVHDYLVAYWPSLVQWMATYYFSLSFQKLSEEETATIDKVCKEEANAFILFDPDIIKGLFRRGLIYFDVPVYPDDRFKGKILFPNHWKLSVFTYLLKASNF